MFGSLFGEERADDEAKSAGESLRSFASRRRALWIHSLCSGLVEVQAKPNKKVFLSFFVSATKVWLLMTPAPLLG